MSFELPTHRPRTSAGSTRAGTGFLVEAMILLVFLMASLAIFMQMFSAALNRADESRQVTYAVAAASDAAERFAAAPAEAGGEETVDGMRVVCDVQEEPRSAGTLYRAYITVFADGDAEVPLYAITTARFEGEVS